MTVKKVFRMRLVSTLMLSFCNMLPTFSQDTSLNKYGLLVIKDKRTFIETEKSNDDKQMKDLKKLIHNIVLDL